MTLKKIVKDAIDKVASFFKSIYRKFHELMLNCFIAEKDEYYSYEEPPTEKMKDKTFWIQIVDKEDR